MLLAGELGRRHLRRLPPLPARVPVGAPPADARGRAERALPDAAARRQRGRLHQLPGQCRLQVRTSRRRTPPALPLSSPPPLRCCCPPTNPLSTRWPTLACICSPPATCTRPAPGFATSPSRTAWTSSGSSTRSTTWTTSSWAWTPSARRAASSRRRSRTRATSPTRARPSTP